MPYLERDADVHILYLGNEGQTDSTHVNTDSTHMNTDSDNRFHPDWIAEVHALLDEVEASEGPAALVTTATGKFFSNGLDTDWLFANLGEIYGYLDKVHTVFTRLLAFPMPTVAAVNGHAFGAGAMAATSHDFRVMRSDRGFYCLPEVHLGMPFTVGMNALITNRLGTQVAVATMTTADRFGAADALAAGIIDATASADDLLATAVARAAGLARNRGPNLRVVKSALHAPTLEALAVPTGPDNLAFGKG